MRYLPYRNEDTADQGIIEERLKDAVVWDAEIDVRSSPPCVKSVKKLAINGKYYNVYETVLRQLYNQFCSPSLSRKCQIQFRYFSAINQVLASGCNTATPSLISFILIFRPIMYGKQ